MSQRFGGKFSPGTPRAPLAQARPDRVGARVNLLFAAPFAFVVTAFFQPPLGLVSDLGAFGLLMLAAWLTREGERAHQAWESRPIARRPAFPRKLVASGLMTLGLTLGAWLPGDTIFMAALLGLVGGGLHLLAFGPDPMRDKGMEGQDRFQTERVAQAVAEAEKSLATLREAIARLRDRELLDHADSFIATARAMFRRIEDDPRDLTSSRRYMTVYLTGARDATVQFSDLYARNRDATARAKWLGLVAELSDNFVRQSDLLLSNDRDRLDVEIDVLRDRLAREAPR